jgi:hypothetical protein
MPKQMTIADFLTDQEIQKAMRLYRTAAPGTFAKRCAEEIITPNMERINASLGQDNDPTYLAYCVEYVLGQTEGRK